MVCATLERRLLMETAIRRAKRERRRRWNYSQLRNLAPISSPPRGKHLWVTMSSGTILFYSRNSHACYCYRHLGVTYFIGPRVADAYCLSGQKWIGPVCVLHWQRLVGASVGLSTPRHVVQKFQSQVEQLPDKYHRSNERRTFFKIRRVPESADQSLAAGGQG